MVYVYFFYFYFGRIRRVLDGTFFVMKFGFVQTTYSLYEHFVRKPQKEIKTNGNSIFSTRVNRFHSVKYSYTVPPISILDRTYAFNV